MAQLLTPAEAAKQLSVSEGTIRKWAHYKKITYTKVNRSLRFNQEDLDKWVKARTVRAKVGGMLVQ